MPDKSPKSSDQPVAVVQLYDAAIKHMGKAAIGAASGDFEAQMTEIAAAVHIFNGLNDCLDIEVGGQVAQNLRDMYQAVTKTLLSSVGQENAAELCERMIVAVKETRNAWAEIAHMEKVS